ncbi:MAG: ATP-binding protein [Steroidobacteraceae bacterium]
MRRIRVFRTESFRLAALFAVLFLVLAGILIAAVYWIVEDTQTDALLNVIESDISTIDNGYREKGFPEAIEIIQQRLGSSDYFNVNLPSDYILLADRVNGKIAGNLPSMPQKLGVMSMPTPHRVSDKKVIQDGSMHNQDKISANDTLLGKGVLLGNDLYLFVGRDTATIAATRSRILQAFAWITGVTVVLAAFCGVFFSVQFMRRIDVIANTCNAIVAGHFSDRIAMRGSGDELDRLASSINSMLDRIAALLDNLRQVSSDIAHDLRTPLTHLRQHLEQAAVKSTTVQDYSSAVSRAVSETDHLLAMFTALLRISQIEAGTRLSSFATLSLTDLLNRLYEMYRPVAEDQGHMLSRAIDEGVHVQGDAELLTQLFINLLENALRHTPSGASILIELTTSEGRVIAAISDTGPGIPESEREKVFRRFYRITDSRSTPGHGLGLALVAAIANLHQARITLHDNQPGLRVALSIYLT